VCVCLCTSGVIWFSFFMILLLLLLLFWSIYWHQRERERVRLTLWLVDLICVLFVVLSFLTGSVFFPHEPVRNLLAVVWFLAAKQMAANRNFSRPWPRMAITFSWKPLRHVPRLSQPLPLYLPQSTYVCAFRVLFPNAVPVCRFSLAFVCSLTSRVAHILLGWRTLCRLGPPSLLLNTRCAVSLF
jgi:hypothetical protein